MRIRLSKNLWVPSRIDIRQGSLVYSDEGRFKPSDSETSSKMLEKFLSLEQAKEEVILRFAKQYGCLEICEHRKPRYHAATVPILMSNPLEGIPPAVEFASCERSPSLDSQAFEYSEPIECWRRYSATFRAIRQSAAKLRDLGHVNFKEIARALLGHSRSASSLRKATLDYLGAPEQIGLLQFRITELVVDSGLRPTLTFSGNEWLAQFSSGRHISTLGALTMQLMREVVTSESGMEFCDNPECGREYAISRKPNPNRNHYCDSPECRRYAWKLSKQKNRAAKRADSGAR
jgi:hypothetical protein